MAAEKPFIPTKSFKEILFGEEEGEDSSCPYPIPGDDGTKDCVGKGHCGCGGKDADSSKS